MSGFGGVDLIFKRSSADGTALAAGWEYRTLLG
jgi:hypothetical protein